MRTLRALCLVAILVLSVGNVAYSVAPIPRDQSVEIALFHKAGLPTDSRNLLNLLRDNPSTPEAVAKVRRLVRQLGSDAFAQREQAEAKLREWGVLALPVLKENVKNSDGEIANRSRRLVARLAGVPPLNSVARMALPRAAIRLLVRRRAEGSIAALLRYLPQANHDEEVEIYFGLDNLLAHEASASAILEAALSDAHSARRAVAACILARTGNEHQRVKAQKARRDPDPMVRLRAAQGALAAKVKDPAVLPVLIALLEQPAVAITWQAEELLHYAAGDTAPTAKVGANTEAERKACHVAWGKWWQNKGKTLDLTRLDEGPRRPGLVLVCEQSQIWLAGCDGLPRFTMPNASNMRRPLWRPGGSILAQQFDGEKSFVVERGLDGKVIWKRQVAGGEDAGLRLLPNGHCLVCDAKAIEELDSAGKIVSQETKIAKREFAFVRVNWEGTVCGFTMCSSPIFGGSAVQFFFYPAPEWKLNQWLPADRPALDRETITLLPEGGFLISNHYLSRFDQRGKLVGHISHRVLLPQAALPNGNILVNSDDSVAEIDDYNRLVWEVASRKTPITGGAGVYPVIRFGFSRSQKEGTDVRSLANRIEALTSQDVRSRANAMKYVLEDEARLRKGIQGKRLMRSVVALLDDPEKVIRSHALGYLLAKPEEAGDATSKLIALLDDQFCNKAGKACINAYEARIILFNMGCEVVPALIKAAEDEAGGNMNRRCSAYDALGPHALRGNVAATKAVRKGMRSKDGRIRMAAVKGIGRSWCKSNVFVPDLVGLLDEKDLKLALEACYTLGWIKADGNGCVPALLRKLEERKFRTKAAYALSQVGNKNSEVLKAMLRHAGPDEEMEDRANMMTSLQYFGATKEVIDALIVGLDDVRVDKPARGPGQYKPVRVGAIRALYSLGRTAKDAVPALAAIVNDRKERKQTRQEAFYALSNIDPGSGVILKNVVPK